MSEVTTRLIRQSGFGLFGNFFTLFIGFPFQIYLAKVLGAEQLGAFGLFEITAQLVVAILGFGFTFTLVRFIPELLSSKRHRHVRQLLVSVYSIALVVGLPVAVIMMTFGDQIIYLMPELKLYSHLFPLVGIMIFLGMLLTLTQQVLRAFSDIKTMVLISSFLQLILKVIIAVMLLWFGLKLLGYLIAVVISTVFALVAMLWSVVGHLRSLSQTHEEVLPETQKSWWSYSSTMYVYALLWVVCPFLERFLLAGIISLAYVGILMSIRQLQSFSQTLLQVVITAVAPMFVAVRASHDMDEVKHLYHVAIDWICRLGFPLLVFLLVFGDKVLELYGTEFMVSGRGPLLILVVVQFMVLLFGPLGIMLNMLGHEKKVLRLNFISNALFFLSLIFLVPSLGLVGVALASAFSTIYLNLSLLFLMKRRLCIDWWCLRYKRLVAPLSMSLILAISIDATNIVQDTWLLILILPIIYSVFFLVYIWSGLTSEDKEIYSMLRSKLRMA